MVNEGPILAIIPGPHGVAASILCRKNPVATGLQADDFAGSELPVPRRVDLDQGFALGPG